MALATEEEQATLPHLKESTFGSFEQVKVISMCQHEWWHHGPSLIFGYMRVDKTCNKCGTRWSDDDT